MRLRTFACSGALLTAAAAAHAQASGLDTGLDTGAGLGPFLGACFAGGLASLLTPCVFPMIPVTVSYFSKRTDGSAMPAAAAYAAGIASTFAVLGILAAVLFGATGISNFAANPWVNLALGLLFVVLAFNLFGLFEIQAPTGLTTALAKNTGRAGLLGPLLMGAAFALTSFTCTMPIAAALLAAAARGSLLYPTLGMAAYGAAFALPFFLLALFPSAISRMPKSGDWLASVKPVLAFVELAAAVKFFSNADLGWTAGWITKPVFLALWTAIFAMLAGYLVGLPEALRTVGWSRRLFGFATLAACASLLSGLNGRKLDLIDPFLPPDPYPAHGASARPDPGAASGPVHAATFEGALDLARRGGKTVFVDFTGVTCANCRYMEKNIFPVPEVAKALEELVQVQLYTDRPTDEDRANQKLQGRLAGNQALPTYVLVRPDGTVIDKFEGATRNPREFADFLRKGAR